MKLRNRFNLYQEMFKKDTGFDARETMDLYTQYVIARFTDDNLQISLQIWGQLCAIARFMAAQVEKPKAQPKKANNRKK